MTPIPQVVNFSNHLMKQSDFNNEIRGTAGTGMSKQKSQ